MPNKQYALVISGLVGTVNDDVQVMLFNDLESAHEELKEQTRKLASRYFNKDELVRAFGTGWGYDLTPLTPAGYAHGFAQSECGEELQIVPVQG